LVGDDLRLALGKKTQLKQECREAGDVLTAHWRKDH
jgi:hypothetical protein